MRKVQISISSGHYWKTQCMCQLCACVKALLWSLFQPYILFHAVIECPYTASTNRAYRGGLMSSHHGYYTTNVSRFIQIDTVNFLLMTCSHKHMFKHAAGIELPVIQHSCYSVGGISDQDSDTLVEECRFRLKQLYGGSWLGWWGVK